MDFASGTRTTTVTAAAAVATLGGLTIILYGIDHHDLTRAAGGLAITTAALTALALTWIHRWVTDTRDERRALAASQRETVAERGRYVALQCAAQAEQNRFRRDMHAERATLEARLKAERQAMREEFEENRATVIAETVEATFLMFHEGKFAPDTSRGGTLLTFPQQHPHQERSRGHGAISP